MMSIRWRITLWYSSILTILLLMVGTFIYLFFAQREATLFDNRLVQTGNEVIGSITPQGFLFHQWLELPNFDIFSTPNIYLQARDQYGRVVSRSGNLTDHQLPISEEILKNVIRGRAGFETVMLESNKIRIYTTPIISNKQFYGVLQVGGSLEQMERSLANLKWILFIGFLITILSVGCVAWVLAKRVLRPIDDIILATSEIERGQDLKKRIPYDGPPDEIGKLVEQSNHMFARLEKVYDDLEESYQMQKRFVSDASHELRTPLTSIKGNIDFLKKIYKEHPEMIEEILGEVSYEIDRMTRLTNSLLSLARADAGYQMQFQQVQLLPLMEELVPHLEKIKPAIPFKVNQKEQLRGLSINGNEDYLKQLLYILVENAFKYTEEGLVTLTFERSSVQKNGSTELYITICDTGIGIPEQDLAHIFDRFYRGENTHGIKGTGLGLPIAKWIVEQHKGTIEVNSRVGMGTTFTITLPVTQH